VRESEKSEELGGTKPNEHLDRVWGDEIATTDDAGRTGEKNERTAALPNSEATAKER
jgi:hypothetical protein